MKICAYQVWDGIVRHFFLLWQFFGSDFSISIYFNIIFSQIMDQI